VERIKCLVPRPLQHEDKRIWSGTKHGFFTVRSAYFLEMSRRQHGLGESSKHQEVQLFWKSLWQLPVQPVVRNFAWKVCNNILPTKETLFRKGIIDDPYCPLCLTQSETLFHILWSCPSSVAVWQESSRSIHKLSIQEDEGLSFIRHLQDRLEANVFTEVLSVMRLIWLLKARGIMEETECVAEELNGASVLGVSVISRWIRDDRGEVVAARAKVVSFTIDPTTAEALAAWEAVRFCIDSGLTRVVVEGDAQIVVNALNQRSACWSSFGHLIDDTKILLERLLSVNIRHVKRSTNMVAHILAKRAISQLLLIRLCLVRSLSSFHSVFYNG